MEKILKFANKICNNVAAFLILLALLYAGYCIWDNNQIYKTAAKMWEIEKEDVMDYNSNIPEGRNVIAWLTVKGTNIDYPVVQGRDNIEYLTKDIEGNYSLSGSIYLDSRNSNDFTDSYSVVYGHNMDRHMMFGDLRNFLDEDYFKEHSGVNITLKDENSTEYDYRVVAVLKITEDQQNLLDTKDFSLEELLKYITENSIHYDIETLEDIQDVNLVASFVSLVTCSSGHTYEKIVLVAARTEERPTDERTTEITEESDSIPIESPDTGDHGVSHITATLLLSLLCVLTSKNKKGEDEV